MLHDGLSSAIPELAQVAILTTNSPANQGHALYPSVGPGKCVVITHPETILRGLPLGSGANGPSMLPSSGSHELSHPVRGRQMAPRQALSGRRLPGGLGP